MQRTVATNDPVLLLDAWSTDTAASTVPRADVVDRLLDLRNAVIARHAPLVDAVLADLPGVNVVPGRWLAAQLERLRSELTAIPVESPETLPQDIPDETLPSNDPPLGRRGPGRWRRGRSRLSNDHDRDQRR